MWRRSVISCFLIFGIAVVTAIAAQGPPPPGRPGGERGWGDPVAALKQALAEAAADSLTSAQEDEIKSLIESYKAAHAPKAPGEAELSALSAYQESVLSGDLEGAKAAAAAMSAQLAANTKNRLEEQAQLMIQILGALTEAQVAKLAEYAQGRGLFGLLQRLAGPPMGRRGGMGGPVGPPPM